LLTTLGAFVYILKRLSTSRDLSMNNKNIILGSLPESLVYSQQNLSINFLLQIINAVSDPIFVKDRQHRFLLLNDAFCEFMGCEREELIGKLDNDFFRESEVGKFWEKDELVFTSSTTIEEEEYLNDAFGFTHLIAAKKSLFVDDAGNKFLICIFRDITTSKKAEEALSAAYTQMEKRLKTDITKRKETEKQQARLVKILEATSDYIAIYNHEGKFIYMNRAGRRMLGIGDDEDITHMHFMQIYPSTITHTLEQQTEKLFAEGIWRGETCLQRQDGTVRPVSQVAMIHK
jgi:PAS domain S-box-containing protein